MHKPVDRPMHEVIDELATDNELFAEKFLEGWQIMTNNGYFKVKYYIYQSMLSVFMRKQKLDKFSSFAKKLLLFLQILCAKWQNEGPQKLTKLNLTPNEE